MRIERLQVDGGFLDDLDVKFSPGMNVIIGGRGTGKTSIIELIRFCLEVPAQTTEAAASALEHALAVLEDGRVTVTLMQSGERVIVTRTASDESSDGSDDFELPAMFSQKEIESLGLSAPARLSLIDSFIAEGEVDYSLKERLKKQIASCTAEISEISKEIEGLEQQLQALPTLEKDLVARSDVEKAVATKSAEVANKQATLKNVSAKISQLGIELAALQRAEKSASTWAFQLDDLVEAVPELESWPGVGGSEDKLQGLRLVLESTAESMMAAKGRVQRAINDLRKETQAIQKKKLELEDQARSIRKDVESIEKGAGEVMRVGNQLREKIATLKATAKLRDARASKLKVAKAHRAKLMNSYEEQHRKRFSLREGVAASLNKKLGPEIRLQIRQAAEYSTYVSILTSALRGSGLRYNELAPLLAQSVSPRELAEAVEEVDIDFLTKAASIPRDRAARLISSLRESRLDSILTAEVEDDVSLQLLDGKDYKEIQDLSVGQRCTVVLPIVLEHLDKVLIVDQPEDHLDNAFIVDTFIKAIHQDRRSQQTIFSTHNANIPVLGNADKVMVMKSDGKRAHASLDGAVDDVAIVNAITTVMEGGREAFDTRARFYKDHRK